MKLRPSILITGLTVAAGLAGCVLPTPSVMPATSIGCTVVDEATKEPIPRATLFLVYEGPNGEIVKEGPFFTDESGHGLLRVERKAIWMKGSDAFFAGGYLRHIEVQARGYEKTGHWENFDRGLLEKESPFTFWLKPFRNRFGAVRVLAQEEEGSIQILTLWVLDGPHRDEHLRLPIMAWGNSENIKGRKLYLRQSLDDISEGGRSKALAYNLELVLREGLADEAYHPDPK